MEEEALMQPALMQPSRTESMCRWKAVLERSIAEQEVNDVAFVRLQPVQGTGWNRADVESVDVASIHQFTNPLVIVRDRSADQR